MSTDNAPDPTDDDRDDGDDNIARLREAAKAGRSALSEVDQLKRENALLRTGIDTSTPLGRMFAKSYDGELTVEAISTAAREVGLLGGDDAGDQPTTDPYQPGDDTPPPANQQIRDQLATGAGAPAVDTNSDRGPDPTDEALRMYQEERKAVGDENARLAAFDRLIVAGANGDDRVIFDADRFRHEARMHGHGATL